MTLADGAKKKLSELCGKRGLILYFYPRDMTPGCTAEACDFRDNLARLDKTGFSVVGVSPDSDESHQKFISKKKLNFPLVSDEGAALCEKLGVWQQKKLYGKYFTGVARTTFLLDKSLRVLKVYEKVRVKGHVDRILEDITALGR